jgi:hypothetical protein
MTAEQLEDLRGAWARAVKIAHYKSDRGEHSQVRAKPCWFSEHVPGELGRCDGWIQGAHWIKRQRVESFVRLMGPHWVDAGRSMWDEDLPVLAAWDDRNGVAACEAHHARFDAHLMPPLVVPRALVPDHVVEFCNDWGLETALEDRNPKEA